MGEWRKKGGRMGRMERKNVVEWGEKVIEWEEWRETGGRMGRMEKKNVVEWGEKVIEL